jgi:magnesium chelatase family protein
LATVCSATLVGVDGTPVLVEVHVSNGLPGFRVVGLPDASCREAHDRVRAAIMSSGFRWPQKRVTVNLAPSGLRKAGSGLDLAMALGVLAADEQVPPAPMSELSFIGELGLDGSLRSVPGVLPLVAAVTTNEVVVPPSCVREAELVRRARARTAGDLRALVEVLSGNAPWPDAPAIVAVPPELPPPDLSEVRGQAGAGKTMLATRLVGLLPPLTPEQALEVAKVHSAAGLEVGLAGLSVRPPFRAPHHSASAVSLVGGGGARLRPGEISCAHHGVLFMDELAEFPGAVLDNLRQPLEEGRVVICRASATMAFPARFMLVAAMNACRCGADGSPGSCRCPGAARARYVGRISGPLMDRFDLRVRVRRPDVDDLLSGATSGARTAGNEPTFVVAARVARARELAQQRGVVCNAQISPSALERYGPLSPGARRLLERRLRQGRLSARGLHRARRVALTLADLAGEGTGLSEEHVLMALALRADGLLGPEREGPAEGSGTGRRPLLGLVGT